MNSIETIRGFISKVPFSDFTIFISDGGKIHISHPEIIAIDPKGKSVIAYAKDGNFEVISPLHITWVEAHVAV